MSANLENQTSSLDFLKWMVVVVLVAAGVYGNHYFADQSLLYRVLGLLASALFAGAIALQTASGRAFWSLLKESRIEIRKVIWPTKQETMHTTLIVLVVVLITGLLMFGLDFVLSWLVSSVIG